MEERALVPFGALEVRVLHTCLAPSLGRRVEGLVEELALQSVRAVPLEEAEASLRLLARRIQPIMLERTILVRAPFTVHRAPDALRAPGGSVIIIMQSEQSPIF